MGPDALFAQSLACGSSSSRGLIMQKGRGHHRRCILAQQATIDPAAGMAEWSPIVRQYLQQYAPKLKPFQDAARMLLGSARSTTSPGQINSKAHSHPSDPICALIRHQLLSPF